MSLNWDRSMIASMTAFARHSLEGGWGHIIWEIRSVNHRYLDISFKMPDIFKSQEQPWRNLMGEFFKRGKIEVSLQYLDVKTPTTELVLNQPLLMQLLEKCHTIKTLCEAAPIAPMDLLRWPGVLASQSVENEALKGPLEDSLLHCLQALQRSRQDEGLKLKVFLEKKLHDILENIDIARQHQKLGIDKQLKKIQGRIEGFDLTIEPQRLAQELVLQAQKLDVNEELERLTIHIEEVQKNLTRGENIGRRLDFLMQELNREANTLGAKSASNEVTQAMIEIKVLIEQMREQIQNVE